MGNVSTILSIVSMMISGGDPAISMMFQSSWMKPTKDSSTSRTMPPIWAVNPWSQVVLVAPHINV